jgi:hypothetical protein
MARTRQQPRGIRLNNPLNIRHSLDHYIGEANGSDKSFKTFSTVAYGYRAAMRILWNYYHKYSLETIDLIVSRWAPRMENDTDAYIATVSKRTGIQPNDRITWNEQTVCNIVGAMSYVENGVEPDASDISQGWKLLNSNQ